MHGVEEVTTSPTAIDLRVEDLTNLELRLSVDHNRWRWRLVAVWDDVRNGGFDLRHMEYRVNGPHGLRKVECDGVSAHTSNDLEGSEILLRQLPRRSGRVEILGLDVDRSTDLETRGWDAPRISWALITDLGVAHLLMEE